jgi:hypothetical protein
MTSSPQEPDARLQFSDTIAIAPLIRERQLMRFPRVGAHDLVSNRFEGREWFVGLSPDDPVWDPTTFTKNRDRLQKGEVFTKFMSKLLNDPQVKPLLSDEHFSVDGSLIEAWASQKSFRPKDGSGDHDGGANFHGSSARTTPMRAQPIPTVGFTAKLLVAKPGSAIWATPQWRTGMGWR